MNNIDVRLTDKSIDLMSFNEDSWEILDSSALNSTSSKANSLGKKINTDHFSRSSKEEKNYREILENDPRFSPSLVERYIKDYFSSFSQEIDNEDQELMIKIISRILRRLEENLGKLTPKMLDLLDPKNLFSASKCLPEKILDVLRNKLSLENCLLKLKKNDFLHQNGIKDIEEIRDMLKAIYHDLGRIKTVHLEENELTFSPAPSENRSSLLDFFSAFYVYPFSFEGKEKWAVIDMQGIMEKTTPEQREEIIKDYFSPDEIKQNFGFISGNDLENIKKPGSILCYDLDSSERIIYKENGPNKKSGEIIVFYEDRETALHAHEDRYVGDRTRLITIRKITPEIEKLKLEEGDIYRTIKKMEGTETQWTNNRRRAAAVDRLEAIWSFRLMAKEILEKGPNDFDMNKLIHFYSYIQGVHLADLAQIPGSYSTDPVFTQMVHQAGSIEQLLKDAVMNKNSVKTWSSEWEKSKTLDLVSGLKVLADMFRMFKKWKEAIDQFIQNLQGKKQEKELVWFLNKLKKVPGGILPFAELLDLTESLAQTLENSEEDSKQGAYDGAEVLIKKYMSEIRVYFKVLHPLLRELAMAYEIPAVREGFYSLIKETQSKELSQLADKAFPPCFQAPNRVVSCLELLLKFCSSSEPLKKEILTAIVEVSKDFNAMESFRATEIKRLLSRDRHEVLKQHFPLYTAPVKDGLQSWWRNRSSLRL